MKQISIDQFLTKDQIQKAFKLKEAKAICKEIIEPNILKINQKLGQENNALYLAYAVEYTLNQLEE